MRGFRLLLILSLGRLIMKRVVCTTVLIIVGVLSTDYYE